MSIQSFLKAQRGDPDWQYTPDQYYDRDFRMDQPSTMEIPPNSQNVLTLRQTPHEKGLVAKCLKIDVRENALLDLLILNESTDDSHHVYMYDIRLRAGATLALGVFANGGSLNKHMITADLEDYAKLSCYGHLYNTTGGDCEVITKVFHQGNYSVSSQLITTEIGENSQAVYHNMSFINDGVRYAGVDSNNINLITGPRGKFFGIPEINNLSDSSLINTGVTTGMIDERKVYYLQTRGISPEKSRAMIINSHRELALSQVADDDVRREILQSYR